MFYLLLIASVFSSISHAIVIDCGFGIIPILDTLRDVYTCAATVFLEGDARVVTEIRGTHQPGRSNTEVYGFYLNGANDQTNMGGFVPRGLGQFFPNLQAFDVINYEAVEIAQEDLAGLDNLLQLRLTGNRIRVVPRNLLEGKNLLRTVRFNVNPTLRHVAHHVFDSLPSLIHLDFRGTCHPQENTNRADVLRMIFRLAQECPPTSRMISEEILNDAELEAMIDRRILEQLHPLQQRATSVQDVLNYHEYRIRRQEIETLAVADSIHFIFSRI